MDPIQSSPGQAKFEEKAEAEAEAKSYPLALCLCLCADLAQSTSCLRGWLPGHAKDAHSYLERTSKQAKHDTQCIETTSTGHGDKTKAACSQVKLDMAAEEEEEEDEAAAAATVQVGPETHIWQREREREKKGLA